MGVVNIGLVLAWDSSIHSALIAVQCCSARTAVGQREGKARLFRSRADPRVPSVLCAVSPVWWSFSVAAKQTQRSLIGFLIRFIGKQS